MEADPVWREQNTHGHGLLRPAFGRSRRRWRGSGRNRPQWWKWHRRRLSHWWSGFDFGRDWFKRRNRIIRHRVFELRKLGQQFHLLLQPHIFFTDPDNRFDRYRWNNRSEERRVGKEC